MSEPNAYPFVIKHVFEVEEDRCTRGDSIPGLGLLDVTLDSQLHGFNDEVHAAFNPHYIIEGQECCHKSLLIKMIWSDQSGLILIKTHLCAVYQKRRVTHRYLLD